MLRSLKWTLSLVVFFAAYGTLLTASARSASTRYERGMVSAADPRAAQAGAEMLRAGGSAADAALATLLALTVVEPQSSGIGGGGFLVIADGKGRIETIDGRETAPAAANPNWFEMNGQFLAAPQAIPGGLSVGVPGNVALMAAAHRRHGKLPWRQLFAPAIRLARDGFQMTPRLNRFLAQYHVDTRLAPELRQLQYLATGGSALDPKSRALYYGEIGRASCRERV